tara:strand:+ start:62 stop:181 length:120 start_codon:yes stop_codon:yes gene_type:complete
MIRDTVSKIVPEWVKVALSILGMDIDKSVHNEMLYSEDE